MNYETGSSGEWRAAPVHDCVLVSISTAYCCLGLGLRLAWAFGLAAIEPEPHFVCLRGFFEIRVWFDFRWPIEFEAIAESWVIGGVRTSY